MSAISEKVRTALYGKLNVSGVRNLVGDVTTGYGKIFESEAPADTAFPYLVFSRQAPGEAVYSFGSPTLQLETDIWLIKALTDKDSSTTQSPQTLGQAILTAAETAIGNSLTLSGNTAVWVARVADMPPYQERLGDRLIYHRGFLLRVTTR